ELPGLFAAGEVAMTGMHGANRLASNSLLEAVVMAKAAARATCDYVKQADPVNTETIEELADPGGKPGDRVMHSHMRSELQRVMSDFVGIVRSLKRLELASSRIRRIKFTVDEFFLANKMSNSLVELRNMVQSAELVVRSALLRRESRGLHYLEDIPLPDTSYEKPTILKPTPSDGEI
ncbi:MAG: FAD-binding protein, partial [candidate division Zixibacteria bacterium]